MTCCGDIGGGLVLLFAAGFVALLLLIGLLAGLVWRVQRWRGHPARAWKRVAIAFGGAGLAIPLAAFAYGRHTGSPKVLQLDLRQEVGASELPGRERRGWPGHWNYSSDEVRLRLPDGRRITTEVVNAVVTVDDERVDTVVIRGPAESPEAAAHRVRRWAAALAVGVDGLDGRDRTRDWEQVTDTGDMRVEASVQAVPTLSGREPAIGRMRFELGS